MLALHVPILLWLQLILQSIFHLFVLRLSVMIHCWNSIKFSHKTSMFRSFLKVPRSKLPQSDFLVSGEPLENPSARYEPNPDQIQVLVLVLVQAHKTSSQFSVSGESMQLHRSLWATAKNCFLNPRWMVKHLKMRLPEFSFSFSLFLWLRSLTVHKSFLGLPLNFTDLRRALDGFILAAVSWHSLLSPVASCLKPSPLFYTVFIVFKRV